MSLQTANRTIVQRTRGYRHGPITRLMSPSDLGEQLKPVVFLDLFEADMRALAGSMPSSVGGSAVGPARSQHASQWGEETRRVRQNIDLAGP